MSRRATWGAALAVCLAFASQTTSTQAAPTYPAPIVGKETTAHAWGVETRFTQSTPCQVDITLNQTVFLAHMPEMIHQGIFNSQVTPALQQQAPHY
ncbi:hypothetical protein K1W68_16770, partial [Novacetimonas hansenii]|nr:hypothetical protein [Novacetimonas hansenii]